MPLERRSLFIIELHLLDLVHFGSFPFFAPLSLRNPFSVNKMAVTLCNGINFGVWMT